MSDSIGPDHPIYNKTPVGELLRHFNHECRASAMNNDHESATLFQQLSSNVEEALLEYEDDRGKYEAPNFTNAELCRQMLVMGAFADNTKYMSKGNILDLLVPFFGADMVQKCVAALHEDTKPV